jgi:uncharacterized protein (DUF488 family)
MESGSGQLTADTVWTVGHSTRSLGSFLGLLCHHRIKAIADVRRFPGSMRYPWFGSEAMTESLPGAGIDYMWQPQLGGRRRPIEGSPNGGWRNVAFQGYADHMGSAEFKQGLAQAIALASTRRTALMCAESLWWRCHRRLISDVLVHRGWKVLHILDEGSPAPHLANPAAQPQGRDLVYPPSLPLQAPLGF